MTFLRADLEKKTKSESPRFCGNCARVNFSFLPEEEEFLRCMSKRYGQKAMRGWLRSEKIMAPGGHGPDLDKNRARELVYKHQGCCKGSRVFWCDLGCFAWCARGAVV